ncbi:MarR family transcriptional regulator [Holzapfeliella sp. He02]|uniref:MarR family transcriptional regulator n=1 Tax=Holzapfeliella saturejae TaxID=3082953 RepID=A0ABU8SF24_9LACO
MEKEMKSEFTQTLGFKIKILNTLFEKYLNHKVSAVVPDLTHTQLSVLMHIYYADNQNILQRELEEVMYLSHPTIRGIVKRLNKLSYIECKKISSDKRQTVLELTSKGKSLIKNNNEDLTRALKYTEFVLDKNMTSSQKEELMNQMDNLIENFIKSKEE